VRSRIAGPYPPYVLFLISSKIVKSRFEEVEAILRSGAVPRHPDLVHVDPEASDSAGADATLQRPRARISRVSSGEQVLQDVRRQILDGELKQGQRVPQDAIARTLGVSRIPVREALIALEREGWITIVPHRGAFVNRIDESAVRDHFELLGLIYGFAVRRAAERRGEDLASRLAPIEKQIAAAAENADDMFSATMAFHRAVVAAANSPRLRTLLRNVTNIVPGNFFELVSGTGKVQKQGTAAILRALRRQDADGAALAYAKMMRRQGDLAVSLFRDKGIFDEAA
jgi:DNA-binding GntR family transcriptional regulator